MRNSHTLLVGVIFCLAISSVFATGEVESFLERSASTPFGRTLLGTLELELNSNAPGDYLLNLLLKMQNDLSTDITKADSVHNGFQGKCKADIKQLKREVKNHARGILESKNLIKKASQQRAWAENQKESNERQLKESKENYGKIKSIRTKEAAVFAKKKVELNDALKVLHQGKLLIESNLKAPAFVEVANTFNAYVERMSRSIASKDYSGRGYVSLVQYIAELIQAAPIQAKQGTVQRVLAAIQQIIDQLESTKTFEDNAEKERIANFEQLKDIYEKTIRELTQSINRFTTDIAAYTKTIEYNVAKVGESTRAIRVKNRQARKKTKECQAEQRIYDKENKIRRANLGLLKEALILIEQHKDEFRNIVLAKAKTAIEGKYGKK
jgi:regulator of replication initiation timing